MEIRVRKVESYKVYKVKSKDFTNFMNLIMPPAFGNINNFIAHFVHKAMSLRNSAAPISFILMLERFGLSLSLKRKLLNVFKQFGNSGKDFWIYKPPLAVILICAFFKLNSPHFFNNVLVSKRNSFPLSVTTLRLRSMFSMAWFKFSEYSFRVSFCSTRGWALLYEMVISASRSLPSKSIRRLKKLLSNSEVFKCNTVSIVKNISYFLQR